MDNVQAAKIINTFSRYRKTGDESLVKDFSSHQIREARDRKVHPEKDTLLWQTMTGRIANLKELEEQKLEQIGIETELWQEGYFRLFVSHSSAVKGLAHELSEAFREYAISAFVAHDDIEPTKEWQETIETALKTCNGILALLNRKFSSSKWTDQEIGICFGLNKIIIPVQLGILPYGFMGKYQGLKGNDKSVQEIVDEVFSLLIKKESAKESLSRAIVRMFCDSGNFLDTKANWPKLERITYVNSELIEQLRSALEKNDQIYGYSGMPKRLNSFISMLENKVSSRA